ncbi:MAG: DUF3347 domain-containing protein [Deltaproteobacteria bacterium]|nr:DUF3347 domain-containing protein [Deltaproteobacteria bacterium]
MRQLFLAASLVASLTACSEASSQGKDTAAKAPAVETPPPTVPGPLGEALTAYDELQRGLAKDDATAGAAAARLAAAAQGAAAAATGATKPPLTDLAAAATKLAEQMKAQPAPAIDVQRAAFAEMSKALIGAMVADPTLQKGRFIFECPMAPAYKRWVQTHGKLQNPYWGKKMLECGESVAWGV